MKKILIAVFSILLLAGCSNGKNTENNVVDKNVVKVDVNSNESIKLEAVVIDNENIVVTAENVSNGTVKNANIDLAFYDANNKLVKTEKENIHNLKQGTKNVVVLEKNYEEVKRVEVTTRVLKETDNEKEEFIYITDQIKSKIESEGENLTVHLVNVSGKTASVISSTLLLYKNGKIVGAYQFYDTNVESETVNKAVAWLKDNKNIDYDNKEVIINNAYITK